MRRINLKRVLLLLPIIIFLSGLFPVYGEKMIKIGITQIVEHPALNAVRDGFIARMAELGYVAGKNVTYDLQNAQGDMATASTIAQKFIADKVDLILSIATPTSQAAVNATRTIPIVFSAVTDPIAAGLVKDLERPGDNVTGVSDMVPVRRQMELIKAVFPSIKKLGIVYNPGEANSEVLTNLAEESCRGLGIEVIKAVASNSSDVALATHSLVGRVGAIYVSTDNTVVSALDALSQVTNEKDIPLITADPTTVEKGVLIAMGFDYYDHGRQTADLAVKILRGTKPGDIPVEFAKELKLVVNMKTAREINLPSSQLLQSVMAAYGISVIGE